jgi:hypothetical protein
MQLRVIIFFFATTIMDKVTKLVASEWLMSLGLLVWTLSALLGCNLLLTINDSVDIVEDKRVDLAWSYAQNTHINEDPSAPTSVRTSFDEKTVPDATDDSVIACAQTAAGDKVDYDENIEQSLISPSFPFEDFAWAYAQNTQITEDLSVPTSVRTSFDEKAAPDGTFQKELVGIGSASTDENEFIPIFKPRKNKIRRFLGKFACFGKVSN